MAVDYDGNFYHNMFDSNFEIWTPSLFYNTKQMIMNQIPVSVIVKSNNLVFPVLNYNHYNDIIPHGYNRNSNTLNFSFSHIVERVVETPLWYYGGIIGSINKKMTNLNNVKAKGNITAIEVIEKSLIESNKNLLNLQNDLNNINQKISNITMYQLNNKLHLTNKAIITGIRNSIAHGHYKFVYSNDYSDVKIVFNDIYEGKITFSAEVNIIDFIELLYENDQVIIDFVNSLNNNKNKTI